jgi:hypothetical protein
MLEYWKITPNMCAELIIPALSYINMHHMYLQT